MRECVCVCACVHARARIWFDHRKMPLPVMFVCKHVSVAPDAIYNHVKTRRDVKNLHYSAPEIARKNYFQLRITLVLIL